MRVDLGANQVQRKYQLRIYDCYAIKDALKARGYRFDGVSRAWYIELDETSAARDEFAGLREWIAAELQSIVSIRASHYPVNEIPTAPNAKGIYWLDLGRTLQQAVEHFGIQLPDAPDLPGCVKKNQSGLYAEYTREG